MFRKLTLKKKIALLITSAVVVIGLMAWIILYRAERRDTIEYTESSLTRYLDYFAAVAEKKGLPALKDPVEMWNGVYPLGRLTVIAIDGQVLSDTRADAEKLDNHYRRSEVMEAFASGSATDIRYSATLKEWQIYLAKKVILPGIPGEPCVIRVAYPLAGLSGLVKNVTLPFLKYFTVALLLVWLGTYIVLRIIMHPLNSLGKAAKVISEGKKVRFPITDDPEIRQLAETLNTMQDAMRGAADEARERKDELAQLIGALPVGIILIDDAKKIRYINEEAGKICGAAKLPEKGAAVEPFLPSGELLGMLDEEDSSRNITLVRGGSMKVEAVTLRLPRGRLMMLLDLTEKARLEEVRRDFFIDAGHEFRTPLTIIRTGLELLKGSPALASKDSTEDLETIESLLRQEERMNGLVDDLLLLVKLDCAPSVIREEIELTELAKEVKEDVEALPHRKNITVELVAPEKGAVISANLSELRRALLNIMENAAKYIDTTEGTEGKIKVTIKDCGKFAELITDDNGPGIPEKDRSLIFERFRRGDMHRARDGKSGGYGLGLSISKRIAERHGGSLLLGKSELGGAAFILRLPK